MTIDERIKLEEKAIKDMQFKEEALDGLPGYMVTKEDYEECRKSANEHQELINWLKELKVHRAAWMKVVSEVDQHTDIHSDGELYIKNFDVKKIVAEYKPKDGDTKLEQQPCEDCVSRAEALEAIRQIHPVDTEYDCTLYDKVDIMYVLNDLPSVTPSYNSIKTELKPSEDCVSRAEAEAIFKNARKALYELSRKEQIKDFQTREMMLLNAEQFIHLLPSVAPKPKVWYISIDDVMSVFDDFMRGDADENDTERFLEMLKDKEDRSDKE